MANRYVRIYNGPENSNVIGFSASAMPDRQSNFEGFLENQGYEVEKIEWNTERYEEVVREIGGVSMGYFVIQPPLKDEDKTALARWCRKNVDAGHNFAFLIDNRSEDGPMKPYHTEGQQIIAEW